MKQKNKHGWKFLKIFKGKSSEQNHTRRFTLLHRRLQGNQIQSSLTIYDYYL